MTSHDLINIKREAYKYTCSAAPSRNKSRLIDVIAINYIIYTHNFTVMDYWRNSSGKINITAGAPCILEWVNFAYRSGTHEWQESKFRLIADKLRKIYLHLSVK